MKTTELMIGDWVKIDYNNQKVKVTAVYNNWIDTSSVSPLMSKVSPIPLTQSILEANGFKVDGYAILNLQDGKWLEYYFHEHRFSMYYEGIDEWQNHSQVRDIVYRSQPFYVHELQHALRLCKLNELADNFKV